MKTRLLKAVSLVTAITLTVIAGCKNKESRTKTADYDTVTINGKTKVIEVYRAKGCDSSTISVEFSDDVLAFPVFKADTNKVKTLFLDSVTLKMVKRVNGGQVYDLHNFTDGTNSMNLMQGEDGFYIIDAEINNNRVRLNKKIAIGMNKGELLKLIKAKSNNCDTVRVANEELTSESDYIFKDNKLTSIIMFDSLEF